MDVEVFVQNVKKYSHAKNELPTISCKKAGVGSSFISDIKRGRTPSVGKFQMLADYFGVTTSELLGEKEKPALQVETGLSEIKTAFIAKVALLDDETVQVLNDLADRVLAQREK